MPAIDLADRSTHPPVGVWVWGQQGIACQVAHRYRENGKFWLILTTGDGPVEMPLEEVKGWSHSLPSSLENVELESFVPNDGDLLKLRTPDRIEGSPIEAVADEAVIEKTALRPGDRVRYVGQRWKQQYADVCLVLHIIEGQYATCQKPDGYYTTWIPLEDFTKFESRKKDPDLDYHQSSKKKRWTPEAREVARQHILKNKPWEKSTGPKTEVGKFIVSLNSVKDGLRFSDTLLRHAVRKAKEQQLEVQSRERVRQVVLEFAKRKRQPPAPLLEALDYCYLHGLSSLQCRYCKSRYLTKKGYTMGRFDGKQRWLCKDCGKTFSL